MHPDASVLGTQLTMSAVIVFILQVLKKASWFPWLSDQTQRLNTIVAVVLSGLAALGIHSSFDPASHVLTITGLSPAGIAHAAIDWIRSYAMQYGYFKLVTR